MSREDQHAWVKRVLGIDLPAAIRTADGPDAKEVRPEQEGVRLAKGMLLWNQTRGYVAQQIRALQDTIRARTKLDPQYDEICSNLGNLEEILEVLDDELIEKLNEMRATTDPAVKRKLSEQARGLVAAYQAYAGTDELMNDIDNNGFMSLDIKARVTATLKDVAATI